MIWSRNYIVIKDIDELKDAKKVDLCRHIIYEKSNSIYIWNLDRGKWVKQKYTYFGKNVEEDLETTGLKAYQEFYYYCGKEEVERMKKILRPIPIWESYEQMHYSNIEFSQVKMYKNIYVFDANSSFTYGATRLPSGFDKLIEYLLKLYDKKTEATNKITRSKYKNLQNYLIGYFARIKDFISTRSEIIRNSNTNIRTKMAEIISNKGSVYISNTDSIITDDYGADVMSKYLGSNVGQFKLEQKADRLYYKSANCYQVGDKLKYSGVKYFAKKHTDFFNEEYAEQSGSLIEEFDFMLETSEQSYNRLCCVRYGEIQVTIYNTIGEVINKVIYKIGD